MPKQNKPIEIFSRAELKKVSLHTIHFDIIGKRAKVGYLYNGTLFHCCTFKAPFAEYNADVVLDLPYEGQTVRSYISYWHKNRF